jgi:uncharacterized protein YoxC
MTFNGAKAKTQVVQSMNAMLLLHSSCQGIIEANIQPVDSDWYTQLNDELGQAEKLVVDWRQSGFLYFKQDILSQIATCGQSFIDAKPRIDKLFAALEKDFSQPAKDAVVAAVTQLADPINGLVGQLTAYQQKLAALESDMQKKQDAMNATISAIQGQEQAIKSHIDAVNQHISALKLKIDADRATIAAAKQEKTLGIVETIFGIVLAPVTGGLSLVVTGIGVASVSDADAQMSSMNSEIAASHGDIVAAQAGITNDQKEIATLKGLALSVGTAIGDMTLIVSSLDPLRTTWQTLLNEVTAQASKVQKAEDNKYAVVAQAWYHAACDGWQVLMDQATDLGARQITTTTVPVGS